MTGSNLVNRPCSLPDAVTAGKVEILDNVHNAYTHPHALICRLFLHQNVDTGVAFVENFIDDRDWVPACICCVLPAP